MTEYIREPITKRINGFGMEETLCRFIFPVSEHDSFLRSFNRLSSIENKVLSIDYGDYSHCIDLYLTEDELLVMRISISKLLYKKISLDNSKCGYNR